MLLNEVKLISILLFLQEMTVSGNLFSGAMEMVLSFIHIFNVYVLEMFPGFTNRIFISDSISQLFVPNLQPGVTLLVIANMSYSLFSVDTTSYDESV